MKIPVNDVVSELYPGDKMSDDSITIAGIVSAVSQHVHDELGKHDIEIDNEKVNILKYVKTTKTPNGFTCSIPMCDISTRFNIDQKSIASIELNCNGRRTYTHNVSIMNPIFMDIVEEQMINVVTMLINLLKTQLMFRRMTWKGQDGIQ